MHKDSPLRSQASSLSFLSPKILLIRKKFRKRILEINLNLKMTQFEIDIIKPFIFKLRHSRSHKINP
jgi:hypothetical protein